MYPFASALLTVGTAGDGTITNATTFSPYYRHSLATLSNGNKTVAINTSVASGPRFACSRDAKTTGKFYVEFTVDTLTTGAAVVGVASAAKTSSAPFDLQVGEIQVTGQGIAVYSSGEVWAGLNGQHSAGNVGSWSQGDVIGIEVNLDAGTARARRNGGTWTTSTTVRDATSTQPLSPMASPGQFGQITANFGASAWTTAPSSGFGGWTQNTDLLTGRYWRFHQFAGNGSQANIAEIEMRLSSGGADQTGSGTATSKSAFSSPTYDADKAVDNNTSTFAVAANNQGTGWWWQYDFGSAKTIVEIAQQIRGDALQYPTRMAYLYSNDGVNWYPGYAADTLTWTLGETKVATFG